MASKLTQELADNLVDVMKDNNLIDFSDNEKFNEFTDLLHEILDKSENSTEALEALSKKSDDIDETAENIEDKLDHLAARELASSIYSYFKQADAQQDNNDNSKGIVNTIQTNTFRIIAIVENLQSSVGGLQSSINKQSADIEDIKKELAKKAPTKESPADATSASDEETDPETGRKKSFRVQTIHHIRNLRGAVSQSERRLHQHNDRMERSLGKKIKAGFGKFWSKLKKILIVAALFLFGPVIKRVLQGILEMTEPMWRPFTDWFTANFPKLSEGIQWVMHALGEVLDFVITLKEFYDKHFKDNEANKDAAVAAGTVVGSTLVGARVAGLPGAAVGAAVGALIAQSRALLVEGERWDEAQQKYKEAVAEIEKELARTDLSAIDKQRLKTDKAELDYLYDKENAKHIKNVSMLTPNFGTSTYSTYMGNPALKNYEDPTYKRQYESEKAKYENMQKHPEYYDENGDLSLSALTGGAFSGFSTTFDKMNENSTDNASIIASNTNVVTNMYVKSTEVPRSR